MVGFLAGAAGAGTTKGPTAPTATATAATTAFSTGFADVADTCAGWPAAAATFAAWFANVTDATGWCAAGSLASSSSSGGITNCRSGGVSSGSGVGPCATSAFFGTWNGTAWTRNAAACRAGRRGTDTQSRISETKSGVEAERWVVEAGEAGGFVFKPPTLTTGSQTATFAGSSCGTACTTGTDTADTCVSRRSESKHVSQRNDRV